MHDEVVLFARELDHTILRLSEQIRSHAELLKQAEDPENLIQYALNQIIASDNLITSITFSFKRNTDDPGQVIETTGLARKQNKLIPIQNLSPPPAILKHNNWLELASNRGNFWTPAYFDKTQSEKICSYIFPVEDFSRYGFIKLDIDINKLVGEVIDDSSFHGRYASLHHWKFHLVNSDLNYLYTDSVQAAKYGHTNMRETGQTYQVSDFGEEIPELIKAGQTHHYKVWLPSPEYQITCWVFGAPLQHAQWWLYTAVNENVVMKSVLQSMLTDGIVMTLSLLIIIVGIWFASSRITRPLVSLEQHMKQYFEQRRPLPMQAEWLHNKDETGSLARSFIQLTHHLAERDKSLQLARADNIGRLLKHLKGEYFYFQLDSKGRIAFSNTSLNAMFGNHGLSFKPEFQRFLATSRDQNRFTEEFGKALKGQQGTPFELSMRNAHGDIRRVQIFWGAIREENDDIALEGLGHDITDFISDTEKFRALLNASPDPSVICNPDGIIQMVNAQALKLTRYTRKELLNAPLSMLIAVECRSENPLLASLNKCEWQNCRYKNLETLGLDRRGRIFPAEITSSVLDTRDGIFISTVIRDITTRKAAENELLQARDEAMAASKAKSMFLSCMSHELRTPLNGILGYSQVLLQQPETREAQRQGLESIKNCGRHLLSLINDILDLSKIENCNLTLNSVVASPRIILKSVEQILKNAADSKALLFSTHIHQRVPAEIVVDEIKLRQILLNLGSNAIKYTLEGAVSIEMDFRESYLQAHVRDTGPGISSQEQHIIFEPFRQLESGRQKGGAGLGLAICKQLTEALGGQISLSSEPDVGSCFSIEIPAPEPDDENSANTSESSSRSIRQVPNRQSPFIAGSVRSSRILVVDDDATNREMLTSALEQLHYQTISANNGQEALTILNNCKIDLVLMDIRMPVMDGITALGIIRHDDALSRLRVVAVTASISESTRVNIDGYGFDDVVLKPILLDELMEKVIGLLEPQNPSLLSAPSKEIDNEKEPGTTHGSCYSALLKRLQQALNIGDISSLMNIDLPSAATDPELRHCIENIRHYARALDTDKLEEIAADLAQKSQSQSTQNPLDTTV
ncbi:ATP-binding protein [Endozoicomonadaceae bacterium StTr2]